MFFDLDDAYANPETGYYAETRSYPHELFVLPERLILGAAVEVMLLDLDPRLSFFARVFEWFRAGRCPCGWDGDELAGRRIVW